jgi:hypothetical protein
MALARSCVVPIAAPLVCAGVFPSPGALGASIVSSLLSAVAGWVASTATWLLGLVGTLLARSTVPPVTAPWFVAKQRVLLAAAAPVALLAFVAGVVHALVRGSLGDLWRTVLLRLPIAFLLGAAGAGLVGLAVQAVDGLSASIGAGAGTSLTSSLRGLSVAVQAIGGAPGAIAVVVAGLVALGALALWVELVVRSAAITIATALLPFVLVVSLWPPAVAWVRRLAETLGALIVSKAVIVLVLAVALDAVAHADVGPGGALTGGAMLLLASFMPYAVLRLVPTAEAAAVSHLEAVRHRAVAGARQVQGRVTALAVAGPGGALVPSVDPVGSDPIGLLPGIEGDLLAGTPLDPTAAFVKGPRPIVAVPASAGTHVWERDEYGPRLVWHPPGSDAAVR